jgi:exopolysaccharide biosynthesis polyprenyl glycosylphosphotransferase
VVAADLLGVITASALSLHEPGFAVAAPVAMVIGLRLGDLYKPSTAPAALDQLSAVARAVALATLVLSAITVVSIQFAVTYAALATCLITASRAGLFLLNRHAAVRRPRRALIVGTGVAGQELASHLLDRPECGLVPIGFVADNPAQLDPTLPITLVADREGLLEAIDTLHVERLIVDSGAVHEEELLDVLDQAARRGVEVTVLPVLARHLSTAITVEAVGATTLLTYQPSRHRGVTWTIKRVIDIAGAAVGLLLAAPLWAVIALAIKLDSPGPVLFRQIRVGRRGRHFRIYKFRSMVDDAEVQVPRLRDVNEADGPYFKVSGDPRITTVGMWLRRFSLDELPQLLNVLKGEMSLVGPRPALPVEVDRYPEWFLRRLSVPPGLTGLWQVSGRYLLPWSEATRVDVFYVDHWALGLDLKILIRTIPAVLAGRGAR